MEINLLLTNICNFQVYFSLIEFIFWRYILILLKEDRSLSSLKTLLLLILILQVLTKEIPNQAIQQNNCFHFAYPLKYGLCILHMTFCSNKCLAKSQRPCMIEKMIAFVSILKGKLLHIENLFILKTNVSFHFKQIQVLLNLF